MNNQEFNITNVTKAGLHREIARMGINLASFQFQGHDLYFEYGLKFAENGYDFWVFIDNFGLKSPSFSGVSPSKDLVNVLLFDPGELSLYRDSYKRKNENLFLFQKTCIPEIEQRMTDFSQEYQLGLIEVFGERSRYLGIFFCDGWINCGDLRNYVISFGAQGQVAFIQKEWS